MKMIIITITMVTILDHEPCYATQKFDAIFLFNCIFSIDKYVKQIINK